MTKQKNQTLPHPVGGFTFIIPLPKPCVVALCPIYLHYWLAYTVGDSIASSGTWKATKVDRRPLSQVALSTIHQLLRAASLPIQGRTGLSLQLHMPHLVSASMRIDWALTGQPDGSVGKIPSLERGQGRGMQAPPSRYQLSPGSQQKRSLGPPSSLEKSMSINAHGQGGREPVLVFQELQTLSSRKSLFSSLPSNQPHGTWGSLLRAGPLAHAQTVWGPSGFCYIWFRHRHPVLHQ